MDPKTARRAKFARIAQDAGVPDEVVLSTVNKKLVPSEGAPQRQRTIRRALNRTQDAAGIRRPSRGALQQADRSLQQLLEAGDRLHEAQRAAGIRTPPQKVGENERAQRAVAKRLPGEAIAWVEAEVDWLDAYYASIEADIAANLIRTPRGVSELETYAEIRRRQDVLRNLSDEISRLA